MGIDRVKYAKLFEAFPNASQDTGAKALWANMVGKGLVLWAAGTVGRNSAENGKQMGAKLTFIDTNDQALSEAREEFGGNTLKVSGKITADEKGRIIELLSSERVHALINSPLKPGAPAPRLMDKSELVEINSRRAKKGLKPLVIADASIDQGGTIEGEESRTHDCPIMMIGGSPVCTVANMPGSRYTAAYASKLLQDATIEDLKRVIEAKARGWESVLADEPLLATAINTMAGKITHPAVAAYDEFRGLPSSTVDEAIKGAPPVRGKLKVVIPAPIKPFEHRVGLLPSGVRELKEWSDKIGIDLEVAVDARLGEGIIQTPDVEEISRKAYEAAGAVIYEDRSELMKGGHVYHFTKEPQGDELEYIEDGSSVHTYFHYTGFPKDFVKWALDKNITSVAFETREDEGGKLPCLIPMSHVDGRANALMIAAMLNPEIIRFTQK